MAAPTEVQVVPSTALLAGLTQLLAAGGPFHTLTLSLYQNNIALNRGVAIADLVIATYDGYAPVAGVTWSAPFFDVDGSALVIGADAPFIMTGSTTPNVIYGYFLSDAGITALSAAYAFQTPVGMNTTGNACPVVPWLRYSGT